MSISTICASQKKVVAMQDTCMAALSQRRTLALLNKFIRMQKDVNKMATFCLLFADVLAPVVKLLACQFHRSTNRQNGF